MFLPTGLTAVELNFTVELPMPPDLVKTTMSPAPGVLNEVLQTILEGEIHSAVMVQFLPQIATSAN